MTIMDFWEEGIGDPPRPSPEDGDPPRPWPEDGDPPRPWPEDGDPPIDPRPEPEPRPPRPIGEDDWVTYGMRGVHRNRLDSVL